MQMHGTPEQKGAFNSTQEGGCIGVSRKISSFRTFVSRKFYPVIRFLLVPRMFSKSIKNKDFSYRQDDVFLLKCSSQHTIFELIRL